jgi:hypothetical protein
VNSTANNSHAALSDLCAHVHRRCSLPAAAMSLFVTANHMLLVYCIIYAIGDLIRAVQGEVQ